MRVVSGCLVTLAIIAQSADAHVIVGADSGNTTTVKVFAGATSTELASFNAYAPAPGGVTVAAGDVTGDGISDIVTGIGGGGLGHVKVFDGATGSEVRSFFAYPNGTPEGVFVAAGRINADAAFEIVVGTDVTAPAHVKAFDGASGGEFASFLSDLNITRLGGVRVASGDVTGDGVADYIAGAGVFGVGGDGANDVKIIDGANLTAVRTWLPFGSSYSGGVYVAAGDLNNDGRADVVVGTDAGAAPQVNVFDGATGLALSSFFAYAPGFSGGVRVAVGDVNGDGFAEIVTGAGAGGGGHVKVFDGMTFAEESSYFAFGPNYSAGVYVAASRPARGVPEPSTAALTVVALASLARRRRAGENEPAVKRIARMR
jgi:hypothetical protein